MTDTRKTTLFNRYLASFNSCTFESLPYVMVRHEDGTSYYLSRAYDLIYETKWALMLAGEEERIKAHLVRFFERHNVQTDAGWIPSLPCQKSYKHRNTPASEFTAYWLDDCRKLTAENLIRLVNIVREIT